MDCDHAYVYQGIVYTNQGQVPGSGAYHRCYYDQYFCTKCLDVQYKNPRIIGNSYEKPLPGSLPK